MGFAIKTFGAAFVIISSTLIGYYLSLKDDFRALDLRELKRALAILKSEIQFAINFLPVAFQNIAGKTNGEVSQFFAAISERLNQGVDSISTHDTVTTVWREEVDKHLVKSGLNSRDIEQITHFGKTLGYLDTSLQLRGIDMLIDYINETIAEAEASSGKNKRMLRSMGFLGGLVIVVVLL